MLVKKRIYKSLEIIERLNKSIFLKIRCLFDRIVSWISIFFKFENRLGKTIPINPILIHGIFMIKIPRRDVSF